MVRGRLYLESPIHRLVRDGIKGPRDVDEGDTKIAPPLPSIPNDTVKSSGMLPAPVNLTEGLLGLIHLDNRRKARRKNLTEQAEVVGANRIGPPIPHVVRRLFLEDHCGSARLDPLRNHSQIQPDIINPYQYLRTEAF